MRNNRTIQRDTNLQAQCPLSIQLLCGLRNLDRFRRGRTRSKDVLLARMWRNNRSDAQACKRSFSKPKGLKLNTLPGTNRNTFPSARLLIHYFRHPEWQNPLSETTPTVCYVRRRVRKRHRNFKVLPELDNCHALRR